MARKTIWLIEQYASTPATGMGGRQFYMAREMVKQGHTVYLIAASYTHFLRSPPKVKKSFEIEVVDGAIHVYLGNRINKNVSGKILSFRPAVVENSPKSPIAWSCGYAEAVKGMRGMSSNKTNVPPVFLDMGCRSWLNVSKL